MRRRTTHLLILISLFVGDASSWAADKWTTPFTGGRLLHRTTTNPAWNIHVLEVKLDTPGVTLRSTTTAERKQTPSSFAKLVGAKAAINGDFFLYTDYSARGLAAGDGTRWPGSLDTPQYGAVVFGPGNEVAVHPPAVQVTFDPKTMLGAVGGRPAIAAGGAVIDNSGYGTHCTTRHPRTAVGLSKDGRTLLMAVVDGRQTASVGMTCNELGKLLVDVGASTALSLDGGGSSAMFVAGLGVVSLPSDGKERVVANHLAVLAPPAQSKGTLKGIIYEGTDTQQVIAAASVTLEGVSTDTSDARAACTSSTSHPAPIPSLPASPATSVAASSGPSSPARRTGAASAWSALPWQRTPTRTACPTALTTVGRRRTRTRLTWTRMVQAMSATLTTTVTQCPTKTTTARACRTPTSRTPTATLVGPRATTTMPMPHRHRRPLRSSLRPRTTRRRQNLEAARAQVPRWRRGFCSPGSCWPTEGPHDFAASSASDMAPACTAA